MCVCAIIDAVSRVSPSLNFGTDENLDVERSGRLVVSSSRSGENTHSRFLHGRSARCSCVQLRSRDEVRSQSMLNVEFRTWRSL